jgi:hypothetical protein
MSKPLGVVLNFAADTRDAVKDVDKLTRSVKNVGKGASGLRGVLSGSLKAGIAGVGVAAVGAGIAFVDMAKAAYADAQAQAKLERTLKRIPGLTDKAAESAGSWIDSMELLTGIADDDLRAALARLAVVTGDLTEAQRLSVLAADAAVASGKSFETVYNAAAKAAGGNTAALKKLFPQLDAGPDKVLSLKEAVKQLGEAYGGAAKAAEDNDLFGRLGTIWGQLKEALGSAALPTLEELSDWFKDKKNQRALQDWIDQVGEWSTKIGTDFAGEVRDFVAWLQTDAGQQALKEWTENLKTLAGAFGSIAHGIESVASWWNQIPAPLRKLLLGNIGLISTAGQVSAAHNPSGYYGGLGDPYGRSKTKPSGTSGGAYANSGGVTVNVTNNYPKPERPSDTIARDLRTARHLTGAF